MTFKNDHVIIDIDYHRLTGGMRDFAPGRFLHDLFNDQISFRRTLLAVQTVRAVHPACPDLNRREKAHPEIVQKDCLPIRIAHVPMSEKGNGVGKCPKRIVTGKMVAGVRKYEERFVSLQG